MDELVEKVARAIEDAAGSAQFLDWTEYEWDSDEERPLTIREFFENSWQGEHAEEVFGAAAKAATQAALAAIRETHAIVPREDLERVIGLLRATDDLQENGFADDAVNIVRAMIEAASPQSPPANP